MRSPVYSSAICDVQHPDFLLGKAAAVFGKMRKIWRNSNVSLKVKTRLYEAIILSTLLYGADVWPLTATLTKQNT